MAFYHKTKSRYGLSTMYLITFYTHTKFLNVHDSLLNFNEIEYGGALIREEGYRILFAAITDKHATEAAGKS